jgi:DNA-binding MarR family transcriptional regulator
MKTVTRSMNIISRCQATYRNCCALEGLSPCQHTLLLAVCRLSGCSQEELARDIRLNKSTVARALAALEERGLVERKINATDKRALLVYPTLAARELLPRVRAVAEEWNFLLTDGIAEEELAVFCAVLDKMEARARAVTEEMEAEKP